MDAASRYSLNYIRGRNGDGLCTKPDTIHYGKNSGYQAINLAYHLGAQRIVLLGYDMQLTGGKLHWHGRHPRGLHDPHSIKRWVKGFSQLASDLAQEGVECINATRETALDCFRREELEMIAW